MRKKPELGTRENAHEQYCDVTSERGTGQKKVRRLAGEDEHIRKGKVRSPKEVVVREIKKVQNCFMRNSPGH